MSTRFNELIEMFTKAGVTLVEAVQMARGVSINARLMSVVFEAMKSQSRDLSDIMRCTNAYES